MYFHLLAWEIFVLISNFPLLSLSLFPSPLASPFPSRSLTNNKSDVRFSDYNLFFPSCLRVFIFHEFIFTLHPATREEARALLERRANRILFNSVLSFSLRRTLLLVLARRHRRVIQFSRARSLARSRHVSQRLRMQNISFTGKSAGRLRQ